MKTPQEEAEEMAVAISIELTAQNRYSLVIGDCDNPVSQVDYANTAAWLLRKIPLPELIAVARAASCVHIRDRNDRVGLAVREMEMHHALQALRATGKVTL